MMRFVYSFLVVLATGAGERVLAQQVPPGVAVRLDTRDSVGPLAIHGRFQRQVRDTLFLSTTDFRPLAVPWKNIERAEYRDGRKPALPYALLGGAIAGAITAVALIVTEKQGCTTVECGRVDLVPLMLLGTVLVSSVGAGMGYALRPALWRPLPRLWTDR